RTSAIVSGPMVAPAWSSASFSPNTQPTPIDLPAYDNIASIAGLRRPRPTRSETTKVAASGHCLVSANAGTASMLIVYPEKANAQCLCDLSAKYPETERSPYPSSSPKPATNPPIAGLAPNEPRNGPPIPHPPSYVKSPKKFAMPMIRTNWNADLALILTTNEHEQVGRVMQPGHRGDCAPLLFIILVSSFH